ncbi:protein trichome birefringence-like 19 [Gastrolobium bilobum]|uniref:protein trichome birefringence-like 19 n=1 Tax=Gastrolobium bilobum TaxID=150636 RepID=UPI002AB1C5A3|nr:protein trichome birefringence-like 19 [Gastrolobium bilobum]
MRFQSLQLPNGKYTSGNTIKNVILLPFAVLLIMFPFSLIKYSYSHQSSSKIYASSLNMNSTEIKRCNIFSGEWVPYSKGPYYNNETCHLIIDQQNCMKFGRPDREFLKWRWKPYECELPLFDATQFLKLVKGKSMAFLGDSVGKNQMNSLLCLLNHVAQPEDISERYVTDAIYFRRWFYGDYNFTLATLWSPYLVRARDADLNGHSNNSLMNLYLDKADEAWVNEIENFDFVIISAGQWFFRPLVLYENGQIVGCHKCGQNNITDVTHYYGYRKAFRTAFRTILNLKGYKGVTFFRTFSPAHFENAEWNKGGSCERIKPYTKEEIKFEGYILETYMSQVEEFKAAQKDARKRGLKFLMLNTTEIMLRRPDGHPNKYVWGHSKNQNVTHNDCVHWCLPGPIDIWNEFVLYMLKMENQKSFISTLQKFV